MAENNSNTKNVTQRGTPYEVINGGRNMRVLNPNKNSNVELTIPIATSEEAREMGIIIEEETETNSSSSEE
jgi:hypothetical protein